MQRMTFKLPVVAAPCVAPEGVANYKSHQTQKAPQNRSSAKTTHPIASSMKGRK